MKDRIKQVRQSPKINLSQDAFGERIGLTGSGISLIESGRRNASEQVILSICREFGVNESWLRTGKGEMFIESAEDSLRAIKREYGLSEDDYLVIAEFVQLPPEDRKAVIRYMRRVVNKLNSISPPELKADARRTGRQTDMNEMTLEELHAELDRQYADEKGRGEKSSDFGSGNSGAATG